MVSFQHINSEFHVGFCRQTGLVKLPRVKKTNFKDSIRLESMDWSYPMRFWAAIYVASPSPGLLFSVYVCVGWLKGMTCVIPCS